MTKHYASRNPRSLEPHFSAHMLAMTAEGLDDKADIAAELAYRDQAITELARLLRKAEPDVGCGGLRFAILRALDRLEQKEQNDA